MFSWASLKARAHLVSPPAPLRSRLSQASAAELGEKTNAAVARSLDYTVERTRSALAASGALHAADRSLVLADRAVAASGVVDLTRAAVAATGRALEATGRVAESSGALAFAAASADALKPALSATSAAAAASVGATAAVAERSWDLTLSSARVAAQLGGRAAKALPLLPAATAQLSSAISEELDELSRESNERLLHALYPSWSGDSSGCAQLLAALEERWALSARAQASQAEATQFCEAAAAQALVRARAPAADWEALRVEAQALPQMAQRLAELKLGLDAALASTIALGAAVADAEAGFVAARLARRRAALDRRLAVDEVRHRQQVAALAEAAARRRAAAAEEASWAGRDRGSVSRETAEQLTPSLEGAQAALRRFLVRSPGAGSACKAEAQEQPEGDAHGPSAETERAPRVSVRGERRRRRGERRLRAAQRIATGGDFAGTRVAPLAGGSALSRSAVLLHLAEGVGSSDAGSVTDSGEEARSGARAARAAMTVRGNAGSSSD